MADKDLTKLSNEELARMSTAVPRSLEIETLCKIEFERRAREDQHKLNIELLNAQTKMMKTSNAIIAVATVFAALLGAIVGAVLQHSLQ